MALKISKTKAATVLDELSGAVVAAGTYTVAKEAEKSSHEYMVVTVEKSADNITFSAAVAVTDYEFDQVTGVLKNPTAGTLYYRIDYTYHDVVSASNPITTQHPISGSVVDTQLWLFNSLATERFELVNIDPTDTTATDESTWIQLAPDSAGVAGAFSAGGAALAMADIGTTTTGDTTDKPFWAKVTTPAVADAQNKNDIKLTVNFRKFAV